MKIESLVSEESYYFSITIVNVSANIMLHLHVMNKKVAYFHKSVAIS